ncbi:MAG: hypothetical protein K5650_06940 [Bacteroidales bacterium]|nr:hypothetical protein [Bacteroidales bacterium]
MKPQTLITALAALLAINLTGCKTTQKTAFYEDIYKEQTATIYVAPLNDLSARNAERELNDKNHNASLNTAAKYLYISASTPLITSGYYVIPPLASAQIAAAEQRTRKELMTGKIDDYATRYGIDAVLFTTIHGWRETSCQWTLFAEYVLRSTKSNDELMHVWVEASKLLPTDHRGNPLPLKADQDFADQWDCDLATAQRCRLAEILNQFVLNDLPLGNRSRQYNEDRYIPSRSTEYIKLMVDRDGTLEMKRISLEQFEEDCFLQDEK